jgi:hypothetical protein
VEILHRVLTGVLASLDLANDFIHWFAHIIYTPTGREKISNFAEVVTPLCGPHISRLRPALLIT